MANRAFDWLRQAERDLDLAEQARRSDRHEWACFACQQAAEKAACALHLHHGQEGWGHVVRRLLEELDPPVRVPAELIDAARVLDAYYIAARDPNGHAAGSPGEHYGPLQSQQALEHARAIVAFCRDAMAAA